MILDSTFFLFKYVKSDTFGLEDLYYDSFTRRYGMNEFER